MRGEEHRARPSIARIVAVPPFDNPAAELCAFRRDSDDRAIAAPMRALDRTPVTRDFIDIADVKAENGMR